MIRRRHLFLSERSVPLPRWLEAFPAAEIVKPAALAVKVGPVMVWLHLSSRTDVAQQVLATVAAAAGNPVVALANTPNDADGLACLEAGAAGYISALAAPEMMRQVVGVVANGGLWVGPELMRRLRTALSGRRAPAQSEPEKLVVLSQREKEVAQAVAAGASNKEIARVMGITERTVKAHLSAIFKNLNIRNRVQLSVLVNGERLALH